MKYLQPVSWPLRWMAIIALTLATLVLVAIEIFLFALPWFARRFQPKDIPVWLGIIAFFGLLLVVFNWMRQRIGRGVLSPGGVTVLPFWFISLFGLMYLVGVIFAGLQGRLPPLMAAKGVCIGLTMVFVGWLARPSKSKCTV